MKKSDAKHNCSLPELINAQPVPKQWQHQANIPQLIAEHATI